MFEVNCMDSGASNRGGVRGSKPPLNFGGGLNTCQPGF